jgi:CRISPR/Cas system CMR subunit Cmr6 (Cas7 group RAMP superfamily)
MGQKNSKHRKSIEEKDGNNLIVEQKTYPIVQIFDCFKVSQKKKHRRLPLEMESEIFKFLKIKIQQKLICGMGWGIYGMFGHKLLTKVKFFDIIHKVVTGNI